MSNKFSDGSASAYAELPVPAAYLKWTRGNAQLRAIAKDDPGAYLGGWSAFVKSFDGETELPKLPIPIVERVSQDGKHPFQVYASNVISFLPITHRTRFELREKGKDKEGRDIERVVAIAKERRQGYAPYRQVFGLVYAKDTDDCLPAVLKVWKWSAFITFERAGQAWNKIKPVPEGKLLIRRYGTLGVKEGDFTSPKFEVYNQGQSTPIEAVGTAKPRYIDITLDLDELWTASQEWTNCPRWNAEGKVEESEEDRPLSVAQKEFIIKCDEFGLTNIEIAQLMAENGNDPIQAMAALTGNAINNELEAATATEEDFNIY
jgi:hypothetical protein